MLKKKLIEKIDIRGKQAWMNAYGLSVSINKLSQ